MRRGALLLATAVLIGGCGGGGGDKSSGDTTVETQTRPTKPAPVQAGQPAKAIAGTDGTVDDHAARLDVLSLTRSGATTQLTLRLTNTDTGDSGSIQISDTFDDGVNDTPAKPNASFTVDGVYLVDSANRKKYLVARDTEGQCVCDGELSSTFIKPGQSLNLSATFGAPPPAVKAMNVFVPRFGTFRDVPIS